MNQLVLSNHRKPKIMVLGNSLSWFAGGNINFGMRFPVTMYSSVVSAGYIHPFHNFSIGGIQTSQQITNYPTQYAPYINPNDIVIWWELRNDLRVLDDVTSAYNNAVTLTNLIKASGAKVVMLDMIAGNSAQDPADFQTLWAQLNSQIATNQASLCDLFVQVSAITHLSLLSDTTDATYYNADHVHLTDTGYDLVATAVYNGLVSANML